ncbi:tail fiber domain-containing protein [Clostridium sp. E02]|uniref:tail fiber domain-containing protein n=1 Tax=Clostridium sp. E02 TaxID=2487134 RepID=UPI000F53DFF3|nr:tail fiber domain-containing protein [Clostridium sp. E02]
MLNIPEKIKELFRADNLSAATQRHIKLRFFDEEIRIIYPEDTLFSSDDLFPVDQEPVYVIDNSQIISESMTITESLCSGQNLTFGECCASMFEVTVADVLMDLTGKEFMVTVEIGGYEMALGIYKVDSFVREQADRRRKRITAYDRMLNFDIDVADWYQGLTFPMTLKQFRDSLCQHVSIAQITATLSLDDMVLTKTINPEQLDGRKVLMAICEINGCFGNFDKTGRLTYKFLGTSGLFPSESLYPDDELFPSEMTNAETLSYYKQSETHYEDYVVYSIDKVQIRQEEGDVGASYGPGTNCYVVQGNYLVYGKTAEELISIASTVYDQISGRIYRPCHVVGPALPWVEVGDGIICYTTDDVIETYCLERTLKGIQGMTDTYVAKGDIEQEQSFGLGDQIIQLEGKTAVIKKSVEEVSVRVTDLKEFTEAQVKIMADNITAEVTRAQQAEASLSIKADQIALSVTNLKNETNSKFIQTANEISLKVSKGDVSSQLSVESDKVTISGNRLIVNSTNFQLDGNGNAVFSGDVRGANIYGGGMYGSYIYGSTIESDVMKASDTYVEFGDYRVTVDNTGALISKDGSVQLWTKGPGWNMPVVFVGGENGTSVTPQSVNSKYLNAVNDVSIEALANETGWGDRWTSVKENIVALWSEIENIKNSF